MATFDLTQKFGPLPVWAWGGMIGGGIALGSYLWQQRTVEPPPATEGDPGAELADDLAASPAPGGDPYLPGFGYAGTGGGTSQPTTTPEPTDNVEWQRTATRELIANGYSPGVVENALGRYLRHECVDAQQYAIVELAISDHPVPDPPGELSLCPPPVVAPPPPPPPRQGP